MLQGLELICFAVMKFPMISGRFSSLFDVGGCRGESVRVIGVPSYVVNANESEY